MWSMKFTPLLLLFTLSAHSNVCETFFSPQFPVPAKWARNEKVFITLEELDRKSIDSAQLEKALATLERKNAKMSSILQSKSNRYEKGLRAQDLEPSDFFSKREEFEWEVLAELRKYSDKMIEEAHALLRQHGIASKIKSRKGSDLFEYKYLELIDDSKMSSLAAKKIQKLKKRFKVDLVTIDFQQNLKLHSAGYTSEDGKEIGLGVRSLFNLLSDDMLTMMVKHEFFHAAFAAKRAKNISSIYHTNYVAMGTDGLSSVKGSGYEDYLSAEELYNWANNSFWASSRFLNPEKFSVKGYLDDLGEIYGYLGGTKSIAQHTKEITEKVSAALERAKEEVSQGEFYLILLNEKNEAARGIDDVHQFVFIDEKGAVLSYEFAGPEYIKDIETILKNRASLEVKYADDLLKSKDREFVAEIQKKMLKEENEISRSSILEVLNTFQGKQQTLGKVASVLEKETEQVFAKTEDFVDRLRKDLAVDRSIVSEPRWRDEFKTLGQEYRRLGNLVKENYKGFAGR